MCGEIRERKGSAMAGKKQENASGFEIQVPRDSDLPVRLQRISEATGFSDHELLGKWLTQEESNLHALQHYVESHVRLPHDSPGPLNSVPQQPQKLSKKQPQTQEESEESTESDTGQDYRQTLLQRIQGMREKGMTYSKIASQFNEEGVATVSGTGKWYPSTISQLLSALQ
jgi:hypothetical protein